MNVFVTGGSGGLGRLFATRLAGAGHAVTLLARDPARAPSGANLHPLRGDLLDPATYAPALGRAQAVAHLAALTHSPDPARYFETNVEGTARLVSACAAAGFAGRFLFVGTRACGAACGAYGASKAQAEAVVRDSGLTYAIVRPAEVYGVGRGEAVAKLIAAVAGRRLIPVPGRGEARLAPVHADDVISGMLEALFRPGAAGKTYTLAGPREYAYAELVRELAALRGRRVAILPVPYVLLAAAAWCLARLGRPRPALVPDQIPRLRCAKSADNTAAAADLGYAPRTLAEGLA